MFRLKAFFMFILAFCFAVPAFCAGLNLQLAPDVYTLAVGAGTVGLTQLLKLGLKLPGKYAPFYSIAIAIGGTLLMGGNLQTGILAGIGGNYAFNAGEAVGKILGLIGVKAKT